MFDVGFWELALIFGMGLLILGPERMPRVAAQIGRWIGRAQRTANQFRRKLQRELELDDLMRDGIVPNKRPARPTRPKTTTKSGNTPTTVGANPHADGQAEGDRDPAPEPPSEPSPEAAQVGEAPEAERS